MENIVGRTNHPTSTVGLKCSLTLESCSPDKIGNIFPLCFSVDFAYIAAALYHQGYLFLLHFLAPIARSRYHCACVTRHAFRYRAMLLWLQMTDRKTTFPPM